MLLLIGLLIFPAWLGAGEPASSADTKIGDLTLEDVIFDPASLREALGPKTLVVPEKSGGGLPEKLSRAMVDAGLSAKTRLYAFPDEAQRPTLRSSVPHAYPQSLLQGKQNGHAHFLAYVDTTGVVRRLYCYDHTERLFAIVTAASIVKWRYEPAKINGTPVPVLLEVAMEFRGHDFENRFRQRPEKPIPLKPPPGKSDAQKP